MSFESKVRAVMLGMLAVASVGCGAESSATPKNASFAAADKPKSCSHERRGNSSLLICSTAEGLIVASTREGADLRIVALAR